MSWSKEKKKDNQRALLKGRIELACDEANAWIDAQAAAIKEECTNLPLGTIRDSLTRGECPCKATLRLIQNGD
jgi:hypothetical protein